MLFHGHADRLSVRQKEVTLRKRIHKSHSILEVAKLSNEDLKIKRAIIVNNVLQHLRGVTGVTSVSLLTKERRK
jgi:hypothetical protein